MCRVSFHIGSLLQLVWSAVIRSGVALVQRVPTCQLRCSSLVPYIHYASVASHRCWYVTFICLGRVVSTTVLCFSSSYIFLREQFITPRGRKERTMYRYSYDRYAANIQIITLILGAFSSLLVDIICPLLPFKLFLMSFAVHNAFQCSLCMCHMSKVS